jgi:hypothetical protein
MSISSKKTLLSLAAAVILATAATAPAEARGGGQFTSPTTKFMMKGGAKLHANTREEAVRQTATAPAVNDTSGARVVSYDLDASGNAIRRRLSLPD